MTPRRAKLTLFLVVAPLGVLVAAFAGQDLSKIVHGLADQRPVIVSDPFAAAGVILGVMALGLAAVCVMPEPRAEGRRGRKGVPAKSNLAKYLLLFVAACIVAAALAPSLQFAVVDAAAVRRGYARCPEVHWPRHQPDRWARVGPVGTAGRCPREGVSPNA